MRRPSEGAAQALAFGLDGQGLVAIGEHQFVQITRRRGEGGVGQGGQPRQRLAQVAGDFDLARAIASGGVASLVFAVRCP